nr:hypothetical protein [Tanacetum cinerariifolium]
MDENMETRCLLQNRQGSGGDQGLLLPLSMRLDVPKFLGDNLDRWIFGITEYFSLLNTPDDQCLRIVGFNLEGATAEWFRWMSRNGLITTWNRFMESVKNCFGPSKYEDPQGALSKLLHLRTVEDYQREFEKLINRVMNILDSLLIFFYIFGLKLHLQRELLVSKPTTLGGTFSFARVTQTRLDDQAAPVAGTSAKTFGNNGGDDSKSLGLMITTEEVERIDIGDVHELMDNEGSHDFVQMNAEERMRLQAMVMDRLYQEVEGSLEEATWGWMSDSQSSYFPYHFEGKVIFKGVGNVMHWAADDGKKKRVKCYAQGSGRQKRKKVIGRGSGSLDSTRISC